MEPEPEKNSAVFKHPLPITSDNQSATSPKYSSEQGTADSTCSTPIPRKSNASSNIPNLVPKLQIDEDEDAELQEALRMSLEQSLVEQNMKRQEYEHPALVCKLDDTGCQDSRTEI